MAYFKFCEFCFSRGSTWSICFRVIKTKRNTTRWPTVALCYPFLAPNLNQSLPTNEQKNFFWILGKLCQNGTLKIILVWLDWIGRCPAVSNHLPSANSKHGYLPLLIIECSILGHLYSVQVTSIYLLGMNYFLGQSVPILCNKMCLSS